MQVSLAEAKICDFGCGTGALSERLVRNGKVASIASVDSSPKMLSELRAKIDKVGWSDTFTTHESVADAAVNQPFDLVVASSVCSFVPDYPQIVKELSALLRPGGLFVQWDWEQEDHTAKEAGALTREEIKAALIAAGLTDVVVDTAFSCDVGEGKMMAPLMGVGRRA